MKDVVTCDKLRGASKQALIRRFPNGETHCIYAVSVPEYIGYKRRTWGTETSKYPEEKKSTEIPLVAASERGLASNLYLRRQRNGLESPAIQGDSPVLESVFEELSLQQVGRST